MPAAERLPFAGGRHALHAVLAQCFQQTKARPVASDALRAHEAAINESRQALAEVVQQQVGVGVDRLAGQRRAGDRREAAGRVLARHVARAVADRALRTLEQRLSVPHLRIGRVAACRRRQRGLVEHDLGEGLVVDLGPLPLRPARRGAAVLLPRRAGLVGEQRRGDADVAREGAGSVLAARMIEDSCRRGDRLINLGAGSLECKRHWQTSIEPTRRCTWYAPAAWRAQAIRLKRALQARLASPAAIVTRPARPDMDAEAETEERRHSSA